MIISCVCIHVYYLLDDQVSVAVEIIWIISTVEPFTFFCFVRGIAVDVERARKPGSGVDSFFYRRKLDVYSRFDLTRR